MNILDLMSEDTPFRQVSRKNGGEWAGACVFCGTGDDRMHVWPEQGNFWCRRCGFHGDTITYLMQIKKKSFHEAAKLTGKVLAPYQPQPATDALWRWFEEQYTALHEEMVLVEWASVSIPKNPELYSDAERMQWAVTAVKLADWYAAVEQLWQRVADGSRTANSGRAA